MAKTALDKGIFYRYGSYHYKFTDPLTHKKVSRRVARGPEGDEATVKAANKGRRDILVEIDETGAYNRQNVFFDKVWEEFVAAGGKRGRGFKPSTELDYGNCYQAHIKPYFGKHRIGEIQAVHLQAYKKALAAGKVDPTGHPSVGERRQQVCLLIVKSVLSYAYKQGYIASNPGRLVSVEASMRRPHFILSRAQAEALVAATHPGYQAFMMTALYAGLRLGELISMDWTSVDLREDSSDPDAIALLHIYRNYSGGKIVNSPKTRAGNRDVPIPKKLAEALASHRETQKAAGRHKAKGLVFENQRHTMIRPDTFRRRIFEPAKEAAGLKDEDFRFHDIRSTYLTWLAEAGTPSYLLKRVAGHESITTSEGYITARERQFKGIVDIFS